MCDVCEVHEQKTFGSLLWPFYEVAYKRLTEKFRLTSGVIGFIYIFSVLKKKTDLVDQE